MDEFWGNTQGTSIPFSYKWKNAGGFASPDNTYLIRYGDIVLLKAEALNELDQLQNAVIEVNRIRDRAQLPDLTISYVDNQSFLRIDSSFSIEYSVKSFMNVSLGSSL